MLTPGIRQSEGWMVSRQRSMGTYQRRGAECKSKKENLSRDGKCEHASVGCVVTKWHEFGKAGWFISVIYNSRS